MKPMIHEVSGAMERLQDFFRQANDATAAGAVGDLLKKAQTEELTIAFCGHFSAGKSSMINALCGHQVLPSGPVPTSANVVAIRQGKPRALIYGAQAAMAVPTGAAGTAVAVDTSLSVDTPLEVSASELADYCKNGGDYRSIEVWQDIAVLEGGGVLLDTPGVDSTDRGHALATDSALHLADVVFYVMDYNHVQSENNLTFAKSLSDWGKPLYLIVNQVDKHREQELSFAKYRSSVVESFQAWEVNYTDLLFSSLMKPELPYNQWDQIPELIRALIAQKESLVSYSLLTSMHALGERHVQAEEERTREKREALLEQAGGEEQIKHNQQVLAELRERDDFLRTLTDLERSKFRSALDTILEQAHLTPAELRDVAAEYLDTRRPGFKAGFLFAQAKTERVKEERLEQLTHMLRDQAEGQLLPHVRSLVRSLGQSHGLWNAELEEELAVAAPVIDSKLVQEQVRESALSREYVIHYCQQLRSEIIARYRQAALGLAEQIFTSLKQKTILEQEELAEQIVTAEQKAASALRYTQHQLEAEAHKKEMLAVLPEVAGPPAHMPHVRPIDEAVMTAIAAHEHLTDGTIESIAATVRGAANEGAEAAVASPGDGGRLQRLEQAARQLQAAADIASPYPALDSLVQALLERATALSQGKFTLALFGAFSAGKSSFANALLGESVLPVSPHPTTAAINRIMAPEAGQRHGTAAIRMKSTESFHEDLAYSFRLLGLDDPGTSDWRLAAQRLTPAGVHPAGRPHYSFLKAAAAGWDHIGPYLGQELVVSMDEYRQYVAEESRSCFVDSIDLYYSCPLTQQGIVLVDTPGADSVNARHTGVTFNYMKHADALVFVTYYNHAFTQGDRQFLMQLGRVKDALVMDQTFFVVNAADLSSGEEELAAVVQHVSQELRSTGIRQARIYPVSSLLALQGKSQADTDRYEQSGFGAFEEAFASFAGQELAGLSVRAAVQDIGRVRQRIEQWAEVASAGIEAREQKLLTLKTVQAETTTIATAWASQRSVTELEGEGEELLYHVRQRMGYRIPEFISGAFHPSVLREGAGDLRAIFAACGRELLRMLEIELSQELLSTTLRIEKAGKQLLHHEATRCCEEINGKLEGLDCIPPEPGTWSVPELEDVALQVGNDWKSYWSFFKSPKHFFESQGRRSLQQALEPLLRDAIATETNRLKVRLYEHYTELVREERQSQATHLERQVADSIQGMEQSMSGAEEPGHWRKLAGELRQLEELS